jgi:hypothetical protein
MRSSGKCSTRCRCREHRQMLPTMNFKLVLGLALILSGYCHAGESSTTPEPNTLWTGIISATNGWEFKLENVFNFGKHGASSVVFCEQTRQLFIHFGGAKDDSFSQWDLDTGKCVYTSHAGKNFCQWPESVSPDGKYLIVTRDGLGGTTAPFAPPRNTLIINTEKQAVVADLGDLGAIYECRFNSNGTKIWLRAGVNWGNKPIAFMIDGSSLTNFSDADFPKQPNLYLWDVPPSKTTLDTSGLYFKDSNGHTNLLTKDYWNHNYWMTKDNRIIVASNWHDEIVIWDAKTSKEIVRQRITNHHNGGGWIIYDRLKGGFLIVDPSDQGTTYLRVLLITKRPPL